MGRIVGIIPSRYASSRFPGKPLVDIAGKTMIQRVYQQVSKASTLTDVIVATDDDRIYRHVKDFGGNVVMTASDHESGTDRCAEVLSTMENVDVVINIQGDEPFIQPDQIDQLAALFNDPTTHIATLIKRMENTTDLFSDTVIKVVRSIKGHALYFSRTAIPYLKEVDRENWLDNTHFYKHIGIYAYRADTLRTISTLPPTILEMQEGLEQLRWLENGFSIQLAETEHESNSVDTPGDLRQIIEGLNP